jgi:hypothetical protein
MATTATVPAKGNKKERPSENGVGKRRRELNRPLKRTTSRLFWQACRRCGTATSLFDF